MTTAARVYEGDELWTRPAKPNHVVQFYESEEFLAESVGKFVGAGIALGEPVVVIATESHRRALREELTANAIDVSRAIASGKLTLLDAEETLATFMVGDMPDGALFRKSVGGVLAATAKGKSICLRAYGEMVDVLIGRGNADGAIRLEELWNEIAAEHSFSLLCAYSLARFARADDSGHFARVCAVHGHAFPTESYSSLRDDDARHREIAVLQQRALALESVSADLRQREEELRDFVENAVEGMHWVGPDGIIKWANRAEMDLLGYTAEEYIGRHIADFHVDSDCIEDILGRLTRGETIRDHEARLRSKDGSIRHVLIHSNVFCRDGEFVHTRCFTRDITARKRAEEAAASAEKAAAREREKLRELFDHAPAVITILRGPEHICEFANAAATRLLSADVVGKPLAEALVKIDAATVAALDQVLRTGERRVAREKATSADWDGNGQPYERFFDVVYEPHRSADGTIEGVMTFGFEVTEQVASRRRVEIIAQELESANRTKDDFLATVSHELRTPLNAILGWIRMLRSDMLPPEKRERALETIERNANAQTQLIDDLLDVSRIISGKLRLEVTHVDLPMVVESAVDAVRPAANAKNLTIRQIVDPDAGPIVGDSTRLQQVVWNLIANAVKFTPQLGTVSITVYKRDSHVEIAVSDTGQGIPAEFVKHVFERFRQADATSTRKHGGLGLGLSIVRHLVELHGGSVGVESPGVGQGSTFTVRLPISPLRAHVFERLPPVRTLPSANALPRPGELADVHVLVVDDEEDAREMLAELLETCKAKVATASSADEAIAHVRAKRPDVIVSDIGMPGEDGYSLIAKLRALPSADGGRTPAVALTAYARFEDRTKALVAGFNMHVAKPVEPAELVAVLGSLAALFKRT